MARVRPHFATQNVSPRSRRSHSPFPFPAFPFDEPLSGEEDAWRRKEEIELLAALSEESANNISEPLQLLWTDSGVGQPSGELAGSGFVTAAGTVS